MFIFNSLREWELEVLEEKILDYMDLRSEVYEEHSEMGHMKPKHHFLRKCLKKGKICLAQEDKVFIIT